MELYSLFRSSLLEILVWESNEKTAALHVNCRPHITTLLVTYQVETRERSIHTHFDTYVYVLEVIDKCIYQHIDNPSQSYPTI